MQIGFMPLEVVESTHISTMQERHPGDLFDQFDPFAECFSQFFLMIDDGQGKQQEHCMNLHIANHFA